MIRERLSQEQAETLALEALGFLAGTPDALARFLGSAGIDAATLRQGAADPDTLRAVLEFLLADDSLTGDFCRARALDPAVLHLAGHVLEQP